MSDIKDYRSDYGKQTLNRKDLPQNPIELFQSWLQEAMDTIEKDANAFTLSTVASNGFPNSRVVLLKEVRKEGFVFFTNYNSQKGQEIDQNPQVSLNFFWPSLERQVRVQGLVEKVSEKESDAYFGTRPYKSQVGAWASEQSIVINSRNTVVKRFALFTSKYLTRVPRPPHWGGYLVKPQKIEFWQGRNSRLHDRFVFQLNDSVWTANRLAP